MKLKEQLSSLHTTACLILTTSDFSIAALAVFRQPSFASCRQLFKENDWLAKPPSQDNMTEEYHDNVSNNDHATPCSIDGLHNVNDAFEDLEERPDNGNNKEFKCIRLENERDSSLNAICSAQDVLRKIDEVRSLQEQCGRADLYVRRWEKTTSDAKVEDINGESGFVFSVAQFNMLAEGLSASPDAKTPFNFTSDLTNRQRNNFGGFTSIPHPSVVLDFTLRRWRLMEVLIGSDIIAPYDIIATEEVDRYNGFFAPLMGLFGYKSVFTPKVRAPGVHLGWYSDGCALFWRESVFELIRVDHRQYTVGTQVFAVAVLRHRLSGKPLIVGVTHLKAGQGGSTETEKIRCQQADELLVNVYNVASGLVADGESIEHIPTIIMGDFNAEPPFCMDPHESSIQRMIHKFRSSYKLEKSDSTLFTTWKTRGQETKRRVIDYIFYRGNLSCKDTLQVPSENELEPTKLPGLRYPSDHLLIAAKFIIS